MIATLLVLVAVGQAASSKEAQPPLRIAALLGQTDVLAAKGDLADQWAGGSATLGHGEPLDGDVACG